MATFVQDSQPASSMTEAVQLVGRRDVEKSIEQLQANMKHLLSNSGSLLHAAGVTGTKSI